MTGFRCATHSQQGTQDPLRHLPNRQSPVPSLLRREPGGGSGRRYVFHDFAVFRLEPFSGHTGGLIEHADEACAL